MAALFLTVTLRHFSLTIISSAGIGPTYAQFHLPAAATAILLAGPSQANDARTLRRLPTRHRKYVSRIHHTAEQCPLQQSNTKPAFPEIRRTPDTARNSCHLRRFPAHENDFISPDNDLFMVRNIGNQMATAEGSVEYGVRHLHTPLLLIIGHAACGAIKAASETIAALSRQSGKN